MDDNPIEEKESQSNLLKRAPEWGIVWSLILSPIAGGIFWAINWKRIGYPKNRWWTVLTGIIVTLLVIFFSIVSSFWVALLIEYVWIALVYVLQKRVTPAGVKSITAWVISGILLVISLGYDAYLTFAPLSQGGTASSVTIGTSLARNSQNLTVSGTNYKADEVLYSRLEDASAFRTASLTMMIERKEGQGWSVIGTQNLSTNPNDNLEVKAFYVISPGTYEVSYLNGNNVIAQTKFTAH